jgi:hypothetical protein
LGKKSWRWDLPLDGLDADNGFAVACDKNLFAGFGLFDDTCKVPARLADGVRPHALKRTKESQSRTSLPEPFALSHCDNMLLLVTSRAIEKLTVAVVR